MKVSPTEAAKTASVSRATIYNDMKSGKLSFERLENRKTKIDISELERVYGTLDIGENSKTSKAVKLDEPLTNTGHQPGAGEVDWLRQQMKTIDIERDRERNQFLSEIEHLRERLDKSDQERGKLTAVITDQRSVQEKYGQKQSEQKGEVAILKKQLLGLRRQNQQIVNELNKGWLARLMGK